VSGIRMISLQTYRKCLSCAKRVSVISTNVFSCFLSFSSMSASSREQCLRRTDTGVPNMLDAEQSLGTPQCQDDKRDKYQEEVDVVVLGSIAALVFGLTLRG
jgi:hypothetical protein